MGRWQFCRTGVARSRLKIRLPKLPEEFLEFLHSKTEDLPQIGDDEQPVDEASAGDAVIDVVDHQRPAASFDKAVLVPPQAVGPARLPVNESRRRLPLADFALPADRDSVEAEFVVDERPG